MKKSILSIVLLAAVLLAACSTPSNVVKGTFENSPFENWVVEHYSIADEKLSSDTVTLKAGAIKFEVADDVPTVVYITPITDLQTSLGIALVHEPGQVISFNAKMEDRHITNLAVVGSAINEDYSRVHNEINKDYIEAIKLSDQIMAEPKSEKNEELTRQIFQISDKIERKKVQYIKNNTDKLVSAFLLRSLNEDENIVACADALADNVRGSIFSPVFEQVEKLKEEMASAIKVGDTAPDFKLNTTKGKELKLSDLRGKWVIIDFWGSWCGWCIKDFPAMKKFYAANKKKIEILGVNHNDTYDRWRAAVNGNGLTWINVHNPEANSDDNDPVVLYGVTGFPTKVVVDPDGKIFDISVGYKENYYDELLKRIK